MCQQITTGGWICIILSVLFTLLPGIGLLWFGIYSLVNNNGNVGDDVLFTVAGGVLLLLFLVVFVCVARSCCIKKDSQLEKELIPDHTNSKSVAIVIDDDTDSEWETADTLDYNEIRKDAQYHYRLQQECLQKSQEAKRYGRTKQAKSHKRQADKHAEEMDKANQLAADDIYNYYNEKRGNGEIDLHALHVNEALSVLKRELPKRRNYGLTRVIVITGRGNNSKNGRSVLFPTVRKYLDSNGYEFSVTANKGALRVDL